MNENTLRTLEFDKIRSLLLAEAGSAEGRALSARLRPLTDFGGVRAALATTSEAVRILAALGRQPYHDLPDLGELLKKARIAGLHLDPPELREVASFIEGGVEIARRVSRAPGAPGLADRAAQVQDTTPVAAEIRRAILASGELADDASPKLAETRRALLRLRSQLTSVMESYLRDKDTERVLQDKLVTTRNDRFVLVVKAEQRSQLPGIIHGSSGSGASVFVEPLPAVELNNEIVSLQDEERREVIRILTVLTARVGARAEELAAAVEILAELDAAQARALLARHMQALEPKLAEDLRLELPDARHPLLMPELAARLRGERVDAKPPVPVSLRAGFDAPVLVISGPNTGGKTVALKTLGLFALMAQCGLHVPAGEGALLPVFRHIYADIGDEQSIAESLSTFSAHLAAIVEMTRDLAGPSLVLLDEVGAGTDPTEGGALGVAIVDHFRAQGALVVATTHHGLMKAYAQSTPGVACASFGYDPVTYEPTYRLSLGVPGRSLALEMAERLGLPASVVKDARGRRDAKQAQAEALLARLETERAELERAAARLAADRLLVDGLLEKARAGEREIAAKKELELQAFARELKRRGETAARKAAEAIKEAVGQLEQARRGAAAEASRARLAVARAIKAAEAEALRDSGAEQTGDVEAPSQPIVRGTRVRVKALGVVGEVLAVFEGGEAELAVAGKRLRVPRRELVPLQGERPRVAAVNLTRAPRPAGQDHAEINLVGLTVDEALPRVDKLLDDAALSERREVRVIHGFGEGRLRKAVADMLQGHPLVASYRIGGAKEGGGGVTIVALKE